jgi:hypothetical protein
MRIALLAMFQDMPENACFISRKVQLISQVYPFFKKYSIFFFIKIGRQIKYLPPSVRYNRIQDSDLYSEV